MKRRAMLLVLTLFVGCAARAPRGVPVDFPTGQRPAINSLRGLLKIELHEADSVSQFREVIVYDREMGLRLEGLPMVGAYALHVLVATPDNVALLDTQTHRVHRADSLGTALARLIRVRLGVSELVALVTGSLPAELTAATTTSFLEGGQLAVYQTRGGNRWLLDPMSNRIKEVTLRDPLREDIRLTARLTYASEAQKAPNQIAITLVREEISLLIIPDGLEYNVPIRPTLFRPAFLFEK